MLNEPPTPRFLSLATWARGWRDFRRGFGSSVFNIGFWGSTVVLALGSLAWEGTSGHGLWTDLLRGIIVAGILGLLVLLSYVHRAPAAMRADSLAASIASDAATAAKAAAEARQLNEKNRSLEANLATAKRQLEQRRSREIEAKRGLEGTLLSRASEAGALARKMRGIEPGVRHLGTVRVPLDPRLNVQQWDQNVYNDLLQSEYLHLYDPPPSTIVHGGRGVAGRLPLNDGELEQFLQDKIVVLARICERLKEDVTDLKRLDQAGAP